MAECLSGVAAGAGLAGAALGKEAFDYNRENFLGDRDQRVEKEFKTMDMRILQGKQWREDVEDLVSLTEKKMHIYNLTTILLVLITIFLWCEVEDTLDPNTPEWLMCGFALSNTGAFMFLFLSIWFAIYAAVVAQSYNARLRTQMVRLPIPTWQEVEACRTYGSQYETTEGRQMFRIPFLMGRQEDLANASPGDQRRRARSADRAWQGFSDDRDSAGAGDGRARGGENADDFADPWGLERRADAIPGLGCPLGAEVAGLHHIQMTRQAATMWQSYDSFARVSLTIGINQLILSISYYYLAYLFVDVKCPGAGVLGVVILIVLAEACLKLEMSLQTWELLIAQVLCVLGPIMGMFAAHEVGRYNTELNLFVGTYCIPVAFAAHAVYLTFVMYLCRVAVTPNGARVASAFKQKLYLDVFGWIKPKGESSTSRGRRTGESAEARPTKPPTSQNISYGAGGPRPTLPHDLAPTSHCDMRFEEGACDPSKRMKVDDVNKVPFYQWDVYHDGDAQDGDAEIITGPAAAAPGVWPWKVFQMALSLLATAWMVAAIWRLVKAIEDTGSIVTPPIKKNATFSLIAAGLSHSERPALVDATRTDVFKLWASGYLGSILSDNSLELISTTWPQSRGTIRTLSCDGLGRSLVANDGLLAFTAHFHDRQGARAAAADFEEMHCPALSGEGLQDAALACPSAKAPCDTLVLHRNGRRVAACQHGVGKDKTTVNVTTISDKWLDHDIVTNIEKMSSMAFKPLCNGDVQSCAYVRTSHGRVVQLRQRKHSQELVPADILHEEALTQRSRTPAPKSWSPPISCMKKP